MAYEFKTAITAQGYGASAVIELGTDEAGAINLPSPLGFASIIRDATPSVSFAAIFAYGSGSIAFMGTGSGNVNEYGDTLLTGTTGVDGDLNIALSADGTQLIVENRMTATRQFKVCFFGG